MSDTNRLTERGRKFIARLEARAAIEDSPTVKMRLRESLEHFRGMQLDQVGQLVEVLGAPEDDEPNNAYRFPVSISLEDGRFPGDIEREHMRKHGHGFVLSPVPGCKACEGER